MKTLLKIEFNKINCPVENLIQIEKLFKKHTIKYALLERDSEFPYYKIFIEKESKSWSYVETVINTLSYSTCGFVKDELGLFNL